MKTEEQIRNAIDHLERDIELARGCGKIGQIYIEVTQAEVRALHWVLQEDIGAWYWCSKCDFSHEGQACPRCGSDKVIEAFEHSDRKEGD